MTTLVMRAETGTEKRATQIAASKARERIVFSSLRRFDVVRPIVIAILRRRSEDNGPIHETSGFSDTPLHVTSAYTLERGHMMGTRTANRRLTVFVYMAACAIGLVAWAGPQTAEAQQRIVSPASAEEIAAAMPATELEKVFWACDYVA